MQVRTPGMVLGIIYATIHSVQQKEKRENTYSFRIISLAITLIIKATRKK